MSGTGVCGAWGGCDLPAGHNTGRADIPSNHNPALAQREGRRPNVITFLRERYTEQQRDPATREAATINVLLIAQILSYVACIDGEFGDFCDPEDIEAGECKYNNPNGIQALLFMAQPFRGHPEFDSRWRIPLDPPALEC